MLRALQQRLRWSAGHPAFGIMKGIYIILSKGEESLLHQTKMLKIVFCPEVHLSKKNSPSLLLFWYCSLSNLMQQDQALQGVWGLSKGILRNERNHILR